ncbi:MAG: single-stranded DNA-binding protein [Candidatus Promineofilum sp.]|nr:single-stranded DNA-binding protein [Promineifilum sp.]MCW5861927.1 single-stranded DNA-binding protein [Anaerolineae bacterium]
MYQKIVIVGRLGKDPEMRYMPDGTAVTQINVATDRRWTDKATGKPVEETTWFRVSIWGRQAETANQYLSKGRMVLVEGHLRQDPQTGGPRVYTRQDGTTGASFEITADAFRFLGGREDGGGGGASYNDEGGSSASPARGGGRPAAQEVDDIPF